MLGDNTKVKLIGPDGFTGYPDLDKQPESQGMYMTFAGPVHDQLRRRPAAAAQADRRVQGEVRRRPAANYPLYGVAAMQVILAAIAKSDGTRKSVTDAGVLRRRGSRSLPPSR